MNAPTLHPEEIEEKKDQLDLRPALEFVKRHIDKYEAGFCRFFLRPTAIARAASCTFLNEDVCAGAGVQIDSEQARRIISRLPTSVLRLSMLEVVDYTGAATVPVPVFDSDGDWHTVDFVELSKFPRSNDHPSRILIGRSTGKVIYPSPLPACISTHERACWFYQLHVYLHELFHTVELLRRSFEARKSIVLSNGHTQFTLQQWWSEWECMFLATPTPPFASRYAANHAKDLSRDTKQNNAAKFTRALAEQICESFVGYILGIVPNDDDNPDFKRHSPQAWGLVNELAIAKVLKA